MPWGQTLLSRVNSVATDLYSNSSIPVHTFPVRQQVEMNYWIYDGVCNGRKQHQILSRNEPNHNSIHCHLNSSAHDTLLETRFGQKDIDIHRRYPYPFPDAN